MDQPGTMKVDEAALAEIVDRIVKAAKPDRIILFGSAARGEMTKDSDVDLLVLETRPEDALGEIMRLQRCLRGTGYGFDIVVMRTERYEETKNVIGALAYPASREGRVIYDAAA